MTSTAKKTLHQLEKAPPGDRFERLYRKRQKSRHAKGMNVAFNVGGLIVVAIGVATYPIPIPSELVILLGLALISQGSLRGARILDGAEVRLQALVRAGDQALEAPAHLAAAHARRRVDGRRGRPQLLGLSRDQRLSRPRAGEGGTFRAVHASVYQGAPDRCMADPIAAHD